MPTNLNDEYGREATRGAMGKGSDVFEQLHDAVNVQIRDDPRTKERVVTQGISGTAKRLQALIISTVADGVNAEPVVRSQADIQKSKDKATKKAKAVKEAVNKQADSKHFVSYTTKTSGGKYRKTVNGYSYVQTRKIDDKKGTKQSKYVSDLQDKLTHVSKRIVEKGLQRSQLAALVHEFKDILGNNCQWSAVNAEYERLAQSIVDDKGFTPGYNKTHCVSWTSNPSVANVVKNGLCFPEHGHQDGQYGGFDVMNWGKAYEVADPRIQALAKMQFLDDVLHYGKGALTQSNAERETKKGHTINAIKNKKIKQRNGKYVKNDDDEC